MLFYFIIMHPASKLESVQYHLLVLLMVVGYRTIFFYYYFLVWVQIVEVGVGKICVDSYDPTNTPSGLRWQQNLILHYKILYASISSIILAKKQAIKQEIKNLRHFPSSKITSLFRASTIHFIEKEHIHQYRLIPQYINCV